MPRALPGSQKNAPERSSNVPNEVRQPLAVVHPSRHQPELRKRQHEHDHEQAERLHRRRADAERRLKARGVDRIQQNVAGVDGPALREDLDLPERLEREDRPNDRREEQRRRTLPGISGRLAGTTLPPFGRSPVLHREITPRVVAQDCCATGRRRLCPVVARPPVVA